MKQLNKKWTAKSYARTNKCYVVNEQGSVLFEQLTDQTESVSRDAHLIAAAPTMLSTLEACLALLTNPNADSFDADTMILKIESTLKKANGDS